MKRALIVVGLLALLGGTALVWAQSTGINDQEVQRFVLPSSNTTGFRVHTSGSIMNLTLSHGSLRFGGRDFSLLPDVIVNGSVIYCSDCTKATPCASGGTGALAKRLNNAWDCD